MNILFVCSQNWLRSPTAAFLYYFTPGLSTKSAGTDADLSQHHLDWADKICVMEYSHVCKLGKLTAKYEKAPKDVYCLDIEDNYDFCEETLLTIFINKLTPILGPPTLPNNWVSLLTEKIQDRKRLLEN